MDLILVRHALPQRVVAVDGPADPSLDPVGARQADALGDYLAGERIDAIWSSLLRRARETASPLASRTNLEVQVHEGLAEWDQGSNQYIPIEELKATNDPMWQAMQTGEWTGGIDPAVFQRRIVAAMDDIIDANAGRRVVVVCHAGVLGTYLAHMLGIPKPGGFFHPEYTSIHRIVASSRGHRTVQTLNELTHLYGTDLHPPRG